jgi:Tfp pilus assembly protein PilF
LERMPESAAVLNNIGKAHQLNGNAHQAKENYRRACKFDPEFAEPWFNLAELDQSSGRLEQAVMHYRKAIRINPRMNAAYNNMGNALRSLKRYPEAIEAFRKVVLLEPDLAQGHYNLGSAYRLTAQYPEAMMHLSKAIQLEPTYVEAWNNLALACKNVGDLDRALSYFNKAVQLQPDYAISYWNRSFVRFLKGNWSEGWRDFEWRFQVPHWPTIYPHRISAKRWNGDPIRSQTLLVHDEQGLGDTFQFTRYLPWVKSRCGRLIFETRQELVPLLENTLGIDDIIIRTSQGPPTIPFDEYAPLMSLGYIMNVDPDRTPPMQPYIQATQDKIARWGSRIPSGEINIGLVWAGRPEHRNDINRSCNLKLLAPLFRLPGFRFIGLQKGPAAAQAKEAFNGGTFSNWGEELESFSDTAGIIHHLDLVLTVDTSVAHLAGAMGRPVWVLIPYLPDWRWGMKGTLTSWYPSMRLFRQTRPGDWQTVIGQIQSELAHVHELQTDSHEVREALPH